MLESKNKNFYDNCRFLKPDGSLYAYGSKHKMLWFIKKNACESNFLLAINSENEFQSSKFLISKENKPFILGDYPKKHGFISYMIGLSLLPLVLFKIITLKDPKFLKSLPYTLDQLMISSGLFFSYSYFFKRNKLLSFELTYSFFCQLCINSIFQPEED